MVRQSDQRLTEPVGSCPLTCSASSAVQLKMSEENGARMRAESRVVEVEKQCSMLEFDLKQSVQKMEQLMKQKERLEDDVSTIG